MTRLNFRRAAMLALGILSLTTLSAEAATRTHAEVLADCAERGIDATDCTTPKGEKITLEMMITGTAGDQASSGTLATGPQTRTFPKNPIDLL
jgi:hypothetical protein